MAKKNKDDEMTDAELEAATAPDAEEQSTAEGQAEEAGAVRSSTEPASDTQMSGHELAVRSVIVKAKASFAKGYVTLGNQNFDRKSLEFVQMYPTEAQMTAAEVLESLVRANPKISLNDAFKGAKTLMLFVVGEAPEAVDTSSTEEIEKALAAFGEASMPAAAQAEETLSEFSEALAEHS